jgi:hypothetical protein
MALPEDEDVDFVFRLMQEQGKTGHPAGFVVENPELLKNERPEFYQRLKKAIEEVNRLAVKGWG